MVLNCAESFSQTNVFLIDSHNDLKYLGISGQKMSFFYLKYFFKGKILSEWIYIEIFAFIGKKHFFLGGGIDQKAHHGCV